MNNCCTKEFLVVLEFMLEFLVINKSYDFNYSNINNIKVSHSFRILCFGLLSECRGAILTHLWVELFRDLFILRDQTGHHSNSPTLMQIKNAYKTLIKCILELYQVHLSSQPREISTTPKKK